MTIKTEALRDRRPKMEPIEVETTKGNTVIFVNPLARKGRKGISHMKKVNAAQRREDVEELFDLLAENGTKDLDTIFEDDDADLADVLLIVQSVVEKIQEQGGSLGESQG